MDCENERKEVNKVYWVMTKEVGGKPGKDWRSGQHWCLNSILFDLSQQSNSLMSSALKTFWLLLMQASMLTEEWYFTEYLRSPLDLRQWILEERQLSSEIGCSLLSSVDDDIKADKEVVLLSMRKKLCICMNVMMIYKRVVEHRFFYVQIVIFPILKNIILKISLPFL